MDAFWWLGCVRFIIGEKCFARCWYSSCSLIVHAIKYNFLLFLWVGGCVCSMLGIGPGLVSMSPLRSNRRPCMLWIFLFFVLFFLCLRLMYYFFLFFFYMIVVAMWFYKCVCFCFGDCCSFCYFLVSFLFVGFELGYYVGEGS